MYPLPICQVMFKILYEVMINVMLQQQLFCRQRQSWKISDLLNNLCHYNVWYNWLRERKDNYDFILRFSTKTNQSETTTNRNSTYFNYKTRKVDNLFQLINWIDSTIFFLNQDEDKSLAKQFLWQRFKPKYWRGFMMSTYE